MAIQHTMDFALGLLGIITSFITFLAPLPTFYKIYKKKSTRGFQSIPYIVALLSATLLTYYGVIIMDRLLIVINAIGCTIESIYIIVYLCYALKEARIQTITLVFLMNIFGYGIVVLLTLFLAQGTFRQKVVGWICMVFSLSVFAAPLCIVRKVMKTKSVEYMPFELSLFLTLGAVVWFFYGFLKKDYYIAVPNILGFAFGVLQMVLYVIYKNNRDGKDDEGGVPNNNQFQVMMMNKEALSADDVEIKDVVKVVCPTNRVNTQTHMMAMRPKDIEDEIAVIVVVENNNTNNPPPL